MVFFCYAPLRESLSLPFFKSFHIADNGMVNGGGEAANRYLRINRFLHCRPLSKRTHQMTMSTRTITLFSSSVAYYFLTFLRHWDRTGRGNETWENPIRNLEWNTQLATNLSLSFFFNTSSSSSTQSMPLFCSGLWLCAALIDVYRMSHDHRPQQQQQRNPSLRLNNSKGSIFYNFFVCAEKEN